MRKAHAIVGGRSRRPYSPGASKEGYLAASSGSMRHILLELATGELERMLKEYELGVQVEEYDGTLNVMPAERA